MHEINVLTNWTILAKHRFRVNILTWTENLLCHIQLFYLLNYIYLFYVGVIRTLNSKYQKFMTYLLVYNILFTWGLFKLNLININKKTSIVLLAFFINKFVWFIGDKVWTCMDIKPFRPKRNLSANSSTPIFSINITFFLLF